MFNKMPDYNSLNSIKSKIKAEEEKKTRGLSFAKLYFANKDYEKALTFLNEYLTIKTNSAEAYKVLGDVYEALHNNEKSVEAYKKSYYIDKNQDNLLFKICEKLENSSADLQTIKVWLDRLEKKYPNHQSVFNLKDKLQLENGNSSSRFEDTFRDLSNVKLSDLTDDKYANLSCSFLNTRSPASLTPNHFRSLERSQDRLFKKVIEIEENFNKTTDQILEIVKENQTMFGQLKNEIDKLSSSINNLQLGQGELKESIDLFMNEEYNDEEEDDDDEENDEETDVEEINENQPNVSSSFLSCNSTTNQQQNTSDVFSRLGPTKKSTSTTPKQQPAVQQSNAFSFNQSPQISQPLFQSPQQQTTPQQQQINQPTVSFGNLATNQTTQQSSLVLPPPVLSNLASSNATKSPLEQMSAAISKIGIGTSTPTTVPVVTNVPNVPAAQSSSTTKVDSSSIPLSEQYKDQFKGKWVCQDCYAPNDASLPKCSCCESPRDKTQQQPPAASKPFAFNTTSNTGGFSFSQALKQASPPKQAAIIKDSKFEFGVAASLQQPANSSSGFNFSLFGQQPQLNTTTPTQQPNLFSPSKQAAITPQQPPIFSTNLNKSSFVFNQPGSSPLQTSTSNLTPVFGNLQNITTTPIKSIQLPTSSSTTTIEAEEKAIADGEEEPQFDFKPIIPLPPKVDVVTGEEGEKVLFQHRCKIYRYTPEVKEFKERGLGDIKILYDEEHRRYRLLMRRDQVHKVCLNTPILENFEFLIDPKLASNCLKFGCCDFSDGEMGVAGVYLIKFKSEELANRFKDEVMKVVTKLRAGKDQLDESLNRSLNRSDQASELTKYDDLEVVYVKEPKSKEDQEKALKLKLPINFFNLEDVKPCPGCNGCEDHIPKLNYEVASSEDKENNQSQQQKQQFQESSSENLFSSAIANVASTKVPWVKSTEQPTWMRSKPMFSSSNHATGDAASNDNDPEAELTTLDFKPVVPLPDLIEVKTGEEEEEVLFSNRAKLFKFTDGEWKERGIGDFKVLRHKVTKKIRFLMRREQVHKLCLNHMIDKTLKICKRMHRDNIYQWSASDFSEDPNGTPSNFNIKFKSADIGANLMKTLRQHIEVFEENSNN